MFFFISAKIKCELSLRCLGGYLFFFLAKVWMTTHLLMEAERQQDGRGEGWGLEERRRVERGFNF